MTLADPRPRTAAVALEWDRFIAWRTGRLLREVTAWGEVVELPAPPVPGQHEANIAPTGEGKTNHIVPLLQRRKYVLALDAKGEDDTLALSGFRRVTELPPRGRLPRDVIKDLEEGRPVRLIVGGAMRTRKQAGQLRQLMADALEFARYSGHWTVFADEFEVLSSQKMMQLASDFEHMLITARRDKTSVWTAYQAQAWVSKHAIRQARQATVWNTGDRDMIKAIAQSLGRDWREVAAAIDQLPLFHSVTIPRGVNSGPMILTSAPKL